MHEVMVMLLEDKLSPPDIMLTLLSPLALFNELQQTKIKNRENMREAYTVQ